MKILIVDDASFTRVSLRQVLELARHTVFEAGSAEDAWKLFQENPPDLVICDQNLTGMNGLDLHKLVKGAGKTQFFLMTHRPEVETVNAALAAGVAHVLAKPIVPMELNKLIAIRFPHSNSAAAAPTRISVTIQEPALSIANDAAKKMKMTLEAYLSKLLSQMLQPPVKAEKPAPVAVTLEVK